MPVIRTLSLCSCFTFQMLADLVGLFLTFVTKRLKKGFKKLFKKLFKKPENTVITGPDANAARNSFGAHSERSVDSTSAEVSFG